MNEEEQAPPPQEAASASVAHDPSEGPAAPEISRRVGSILDAVEREAARLREEARVEATAYLDNARRRADGLVAERQRRIGELSDELIAKSEAVIARLDDAAPVRQGFENLVRALGDAAERLAHEAEDTASDFEPPAFGAAIPQQQPQAAVDVHPQPTYPAHQTAPYPPAGSPYGHGVPAQPQPYGTEPAQPYSAEPAQPYGAEPAQPYRPQPHGAEPTSSQPHPTRAASTHAWRGLGGGQPPAAQPAAPDPGWREQDEARMVAIQMAASGATRGSVREHLHQALGLRDTGPVLDEVFGPGSGENAQVPWTSSRR